MSTPQSSVHDQTRQTLLGLLSRTLFGMDYSPAPDENYVAVFEESLHQTVSLTAFSGRAVEVIPPEVREELKPHLRPYLLHNSRIFAEHTHIDAVLTAAQIPYCIIKGAASAAYYPEPWLRGMGDVDFFVSEADTERAREALISAGFTAEDTDSPYHLPFRYRSVLFEMHRELPGLPMERELGRDEMREAVKALRSDLLTSARRMAMPTLNCVVPDPFHHGLILLLHTQQHLLTEGIGLRHLSDWAVFVGSIPVDTFESIFRDRLASVGLWRFACLLSLAASRSLGLPHAAWMGDSEHDQRVADALVDDLIRGGNFGSKDPNRERVYEGMLLANRTKGRTGGGRLRNGIASVNTWVRNRWPAAARCPLLLPIGWIYFLLRRSVLVLTGKKKRISYARAMRGSRDRRRIYDELHLFEMQK